MSEENRTAKGTPLTFYYYVELEEHSVERLYLRQSCFDG